MEPNIRQIIAQLDDDIESASFRLAEGRMYDDFNESTKEFTQGCLQMLIGFGRVLRGALKDAEEDEPK